MNKAEIFNSTESLAEPPPTLSLELQSLWWLKKGDWDKAHDLAQDVGSKQGDWIHAHLHRIEGDLANAAYWYSRAGKPVCRDEFSKEWQEITSELLLG